MFCFLAAREERRPFLKGFPIHAKAYVQDDQVIGHSEQRIVISSVKGHPSRFPTSILSIQQPGVALAVILRRRLLRGHGPAETRTAAAARHTTLY